MDEFGFIAACLAPLASRAPEALGLKDDAALITPRPGHQLVVTQDAITQSVHFIGDEPPADLARKLLRVNLSDLAAMGAEPYGCFLSLMLPAACDEAWLRGFASGLADDLGHYGLSLFGGDTTRIRGGLALSLTALGYVPDGTAIHRSGAVPGDFIYVSGTLGDAALGLRVAESALKSLNADERWLLDRYRLPQPRIALGQRLRGIAHAMLDISDGLAQDLGHLCAASDVGATLDADALPVSEAAGRFAHPANWLETLLTGGDDYELLFAAAPADAPCLAALAVEMDVPLTRIGVITAGQGVHIHCGGQTLHVEHSGYRHF